jgi:GNAT superfamily N-acetyltransferase
MPNRVEGLESETSPRFEGRDADVGAGRVLRLGSWDFGPRSSSRFVLRIQSTLCAIMEMKMHTCSLHKELEVVSGDMSDYNRLASYHYREGRPAVISAVFAARPRRPLGALGRRPAGVIVYSMPSPRLELRGVATGHCFAGLDRQTELALLNRNVRCIARVVIEPRFRGIGLASRLVRETMPALNVPIVEALGVMPLVNPFLERAGMRAFPPRVPVEHVELLEALSAVGIEEDSLVDPEAVQRMLDRLAGPAADFLEARIQHFLKSHGARRTMPAGMERTKYILGKLAHRPVYYIWFNPLMVGCGPLNSDSHGASTHITNHIPQFDHPMSEVCTS